MTEMQKAKNELNPSFIQESLSEKKVNTICEIITNLLNSEWDTSATGQKASDSKVRSCAKRYHQLSRIQM